MAKFFYAVRKGETPGIYENWAECEKQVKGYKGAEYKKFKSLKEATEFIQGKGYKDTIEEGSIVNLKEIKENEMIAYVDGSFSLALKTYSYGVVILTKGGKETFKGKSDNKEMVEMRNVSGELEGAMVAMDIALERKVKTLYLHYDYAGIEKWALGEWKTNKKGTRQYKEYYDSIKSRLKVVFVKVAAHTGIKYNEEADKLAKEALL